MEHIATSDAAQLAGVSLSTIRNYIRDGRLTEYRKGGRLFVDKAEVLATFSTERVSPPSRSPAIRVIAICNQKGGTGKTSTTSALGFLLGQHAPTLLIDADPQANLTQSFGLRPDKLETTLYEVLVHGKPIADVIHAVPPPPAALAIIGSNLDVAATTLQMAGRPTYAIQLQKALETLGDRYKFVVIDCPPNLDALTVNALVAATEVIVPVEMGAYSLRGVSRLLDVIRDLKILNPRLSAPRYLACRVKSNNRLSSRILDDLTSAFPARTLKTVIREGTAVGQAQYAKQPLAVYAPTSAPAKDYEALCKEILNEQAD